MRKKEPPPTVPPKPRKSMGLQEYSQNENNPSSSTNNNEQFRITRKDKNELIRIGSVRNLKQKFENNLTLYSPKIERVVEENKPKTNYIIQGTEMSQHKDSEAPQINFEHCNGIEDDNNENKIEQSVEEVNQSPNLKRNFPNSFKSVIKEVTSMNNSTKEYTVMEEFKDSEKKYVEKIVKFAEEYIPIMETKLKGKDKIRILTLYQQLAKDTKIFLEHLESEDCLFSEDIGKILCKIKLWKPLKDYIDHFNQMNTKYSPDSEIEDVFKEEKRKSSDITVVLESAYDYFQLPFNRAISYTTLLKQMIKTEEKDNFNTDNLKQALDGFLKVLTDSNALSAINSIKKLNFVLIPYVPYICSGEFVNRKKIQYELFLFQHIILFTTHKPEKFTFENSIRIKDLDFTLNSEFYEFTLKTKNIKYELKPTGPESTTLLDKLLKLVVDLIKSKSN